MNYASETSTNKQEYKMRDNCPKSVGNSVESYHPSSSVYSESNSSYSAVSTSNQPKNNLVFKVGLERISSSGYNRNSHLDISLSVTPPSSGCRPRMVRLDEAGRRRIPIEQAGLLIKV